MKGLWLGCLLISMIFIGLAIRNLLSTARKTVVRLVGVVLFLAEASFLLYLPVFFLQNNFVTALAADLINVMRVVSLDAGYLDHKDFIIQNIGSGTFFRIYMAALGILHFLMPLLSIMAVYSIFFLFFSHIRIMLINLFGNRTVYIFNTASHRAMLLSEDIQTIDPKASFVFAGIKDKSENGEADFLSSAILHPDSIENISLKRKPKRDLCYFFLSDDESTNINEALNQLSCMNGISPQLQEMTHLFVGVWSKEAESLLDSAVKGSVDVHVLRAEETAVYRLINEHPLYKNADGQLISVLVLGLGDMGEAFVRAAGWCGQLYGYRLKINVAGIRIRDEIRDFQFRCPGYSGVSCLELHFYDCEDNAELFEIIEKHCQDTTYAVVTQGSDMEITQTAIRLRRTFLHLDFLSSGQPEIYAYIRNQEQADVLDRLQTSDSDPDRRISYRLTSFGCDEEIFTYKNIIDSDWERLSKNAHLVYEAISAGHDINITEALAHRSVLELNKRSGMAYALHIRYQLAQLGLDYTRDPDAAEVDFASFLSEEKLDQLVRAEHDRWQMFLVSEGWTPAAISDVEAYAEAGYSSGRYSIALMKMHPYICPFEEIVDRSVSSGQKRIIDCDRELIRHIPDILHDRFGVSGIQYKIIRKEPDRKEP